MRSLLATMVVLLVITGCSRKTQNPHSGVLLNAQANALEAKIALTELRAGRVTNALELLEQKIDSSVIIIDHSLSKVADRERDAALGTLRALKAYREAHPRQREAIIPDVDTKEMAQEASRILGELK